MSEMHAVDPEKVVKEILDHVWHNVRKTYAVKDTELVMLILFRLLIQLIQLPLYKLTLKIPAKHLSGILWWQV